MSLLSDFFLLWVDWGGGGLNYLSYMDVVTSNGDSSDRETAIRFSDPSSR